MGKLTKTISLKNNIIYLLLIGWVIPVLIMAMLLGTYVDTKSYEQASDTALSTLIKADDMFAMELKACETASKNASYYSRIREAYLNYISDFKLRDFESEVNGFLASEYKYNDISKSAVIIFPEILATYYTYNTSASGSYKDISAFLNRSDETVMKVSEEIGTRTALVADNGYLYMVRNLVLPDFSTYAVLIIELNSASLLTGYENVWGYESAAILVDGEYMVGDGSISQDAIEIIGRQEPEIFMRKSANSYAMVSREYYGRKVTAVVKLDNSVLYRRIYSTWIIFGLMILFMFPLTVTIFRFFRKHVTEPVDTLVKAYGEVADNNLGFTIGNLAKTKEFYYMEESFNGMSLKIKEQFDRILSEEIALRDAKIMALQSQINPHFLNNTFEIINWEARLNGNIKVSKMIEALSTMLEATMNRGGDKMYSLAEEMSYVDAYAYIISERLGDKFTYVKEIDDKFLSVRVPKLIIQPIVENAVEHGLSKVSVGRITIRVREDGHFIYIEVINDGVLGKEDMDKINRLLNETIQPEKERSLSLGIRNVNNRLKLMYGEDSGLTIENLDDKSTISTIRIITT